MIDIDKSCYDALYNKFIYSFLDKPYINDIQKDALFNFIEGIVDKLNIHLISDISKIKQTDYANYNIRNSFTYESMYDKETSVYASTANKYGAYQEIAIPLLYQNSDNEYIKYISTNMIRNIHNEFIKYIKK